MIKLFSDRFIFVVNNKNNIGLKYLEFSINRKVQSLMVNVFEAVSDTQDPALKISELMHTQSIFERVFEIVKETGFYNDDENLRLMRALNIDTGEGDLKNALYTTWTIMGNNLNKSKSQEEFNAKFALFVPTILKRMEAIHGITI